MGRRGRWLAIGSGLAIAIAIASADVPPPKGPVPGGGAIALPAVPPAAPPAVARAAKAPHSPGPATGSQALRVLLGAPVGLPGGTVARRTTPFREGVGSLGATRPVPAAHTTGPTAAQVRAVNQKADSLLSPPPLSKPITKTISAGAPDVALEADRDYIIKVRSGTVFTKPVSITGGRNVVLENLVIKYRAPLGALPGWKARGLLLQDQTGVMWVNNIHIRGPLAEGIDLSQKKSAAVVLRTIAIDPVDGSESTNHADLLQTWAGPGRLVVDGLTGTSDFQGVFLQPDDTWDGPDPQFIVLRHIQIDVSKGIYALSSYAHGAYPVLADDVRVKYNPARPDRDQWLWPKPSTGDTTWSKVIGIGPGGSTA